MTSTTTVTREHIFEGELRWTGQTEQVGEKLKIERSFVLEFPGKPPLPGSSPAVFSGDDSWHNPESLMVASLMACHHLTYLALAERAGIKIAAYRDRAAGRLAIREGKMRMVEVVLHPSVTIVDPAMAERARALHEKAHANCFMSNSVNFDVRVEPSEGK
jgi:organic hydroperoxide reductase OsmC/OhrA